MIKDCRLYFKFFFSISFSISKLAQIEKIVDSRLYSNSFTRLAQIEKARAKLQSDLEAQAQALDQAQILNNSMEKKAKQFDR